MNLLSRLAPVWPALLLACLPGAAAAFSPTACQFTIDMPEPVQEQVTKLGGHIYIGQHGGDAYIASCSELSRHVTVTDANVQDLLDRARDGATSDAKIVSEKRLTVQGYPARDLQTKTNDGYFVRLRLIIARQQLYQVLFVTDPGKANAPEIEPYINSFHLTGK